MIETIDTTTPTLSSSSMQPAYTRTTYRRKIFKMFFFTMTYETFQFQIRFKNLSTHTRSILMGINLGRAVGREEVEEARRKGGIIEKKPDN